MQNLTPAQLEIRATGNFLCVVGLIWAFFLIAITLFSRLDLSFFPMLFTLITGLFLRKGSYLIARRAACLNSAMLAIYCIFLLMALITALYQRNYTSMHMSLSIGRTPVSVWGNLYMISIALLELWTYKMLTNPLIKSGMKEAGIPYQPFWRYGTARGALIVSIIPCVILCVFFTQTLVIAEQIFELAKLEMKKKHLHCHNEATFNRTQHHVDRCLE